VRDPAPTEPRVVFADEPTGALDSLNGEHVMRLLSEAARDSSAAVVLVTHEPRVAAWSDREVVEANAGKQVGPASERGEAIVSLARPGPTPSAARLRAALAATPGVRSVAR
jgi:ABC-type dipeptide/oligopeptide/nickel transport system ATPase component